jgi:hypothetical protein
MKAHSPAAVRRLALATGRLVARERYGRIYRERVGTMIARAKLADELAVLEATLPRMAEVFRV